jgi:hypothetical protein
MTFFFGVPITMHFPSRHSSHGDQPSIWKRVGRDYSSFYRRDALFRFGAGFGVGALMANTNIDHEIHRTVQSRIRNANSDEWFEYFHASKELGNPLYAVPILVSAWFVGSQLEESVPAMHFAGDWGERSVRGYLLGVPHVLALQSLTGGSRPGERSYQSHWRPLADDNGVSGHGFVSALPFITAAKLTERPVLKGLFYFASAMGPLSRINDDAHYPSQAFLGWWVALTAASAVERSDGTTKGWSLKPSVTGSNVGITAELVF